MPLSSFRLARLWLASGLMIVTSFTSAWAQEAPVDPNYQDLVLPEQTDEGFHPVSQLATPEIDCPNCAPAPAAWHPPILFPNPEVCCPTGVPARDWKREHTTGHWLNYRQRMLEKDYAWRVQNGQQPVCCPPWSCWGHSCDECNGIGCKKRRSWFRLCGHEDGPCGNPCGADSGVHGCADQTSALENAALQGVELASGETLAPITPPALEPQFAPGELGWTAESIGDSPVGEIELVSDEQFAAAGGAIVETAGFCEVSDGCAPNSGPVYMSHGPYSYTDDCWEDDGCDCPRCRLCRHLHDYRNCFCRFLYDDGLYGGGPNGIARRRGGWRREIPSRGQYWMGYPVNPYHFDQRDGRIYGAQGYGHAVGVPLAPNVEHTFNYGWGLPSSRLTPISRMPGAPGVAIPAVPGAAGPGVLPPAYPAPLSAGFGQ